MEGSGYVKTSDPAKAAEVEQAYQNALAARTMYDSFWSPPYDPDGSNAQAGWPGNATEIICNDCCAQPLDVSNAHVGSHNSEYIRRIYGEWEDAAYDPTTEFTGIIDADTRIVTIDYPLEIFDVSGYACGEIKIQEEPVPFDESDVIELIP